MADGSGSPLSVIRSPEVRQLWTKSLEPLLKDLGFRAGKSSTGGSSGWDRQQTNRSESFWFQIGRSGFDRYRGGQFVVEFIVTDTSRGVSLRDRMWRLIDDNSRQRAVDLNNRVIASLPGPSIEMLNALPESLRSTYVDSFKTMSEVPARDQDVWFRYATRTDVIDWGEYVASQLASVLNECESKLVALEPGTSSLFGVIQAS